MFGAIAFFLGWIFIGCWLIVASIDNGSVFMALIGMAMFVIPWIIGRATRCNDPSTVRHIQKEKRIEKEYGIIDYSEKK